MFERTTHAVPYSHDDSYYICLHLPHSRWLCAQVRSVKTWYVLQSNARSKRGAVKALYCLCDHSVEGYDSPKIITAAMVPFIQMPNILAF